MEQFSRWKIIFIQKHCLWQRFHSQLSIRHNSGGMGFDEISVFHVSSLINSPLFLVYLIFYVRVSLTQLTNLLCSSLTANHLSGNIPAHLGSFTALAYLYGLNLLYCSTSSLSYSNIASNASLLCSPMFISLYQMQL